MPCWFQEIGFSPDWHSWGPEVGNSESIVLRFVVKDFGGGAIKLSCSDDSDSDRVDATGAVITAIKVGSVQ
jgi:hypothetical protein